MFNDDWYGPNLGTTSDFTDQVTLNNASQGSSRPIISSNGFNPAVSNTVVTSEDSNTGQVNGAVPQFTGAIINLMCMLVNFVHIDGLEDEDLDKLLQDFEEDQLICT